MKRARHARRSKDPIGAAAGRDSVTVPVLPPRNPLVAPVHRRKAGAHHGGARQRRQLEKLELRKLLDE